MALRRNERYPGRFDNPSPEHPQGAFKNRSAPNANDGSYCERDWGNDWDGFFAAMMKAAGMTANGAVDTALASQYFDAMLTVNTGRLLNIRTFSTSDIYTPTAGTAFIIVEGVGGGAGGGGSSSPTAGFYSAAGGGTAGTYAKVKISNPPSAVTVTIGAKGVGGTAGTGPANSGEGTPGGDTTFGTFLMCPGGKESKGSYSFPSNSVTASEYTGSAGNTVINGGTLITTVNGESSAPGRILGTYMITGRGGSTMLGIGGIPRFRPASELASGAAAAGYGSGGGGACSGPTKVGMPGGDGRPGCVIVWEYA